MESTGFAMNRKPARGRRDYVLLLAVLIAAGAICICIIPMILSGVYTHNYHDFTDRYTQSMNAGNKLADLTVTSPGSENTIVSQADAGKVYSLLLHTGMGKVQKIQPDTPPVTLTLKDGATLSFWEVEIPEKSAARPLGLFVRFDDGAGYVYQYDTDRIGLKSITDILLPGK